MGLSLIGSKIKFGLYYALIHFLTKWSNTYEYNSYDFSTKHYAATCY